MSISLKINVATIPEEGLSLTLSEDGKRFDKCLRDGDHTDFSLRKVDLRCQINITSGTIFVRGNLSVLLDIACSRCLEDVSLPIGGDFTYSLLPGEPETKEDVELTAEDLDISYYSGDFIDLTPIICEQIILHIPFKALCSEECKGLCPHCGTNLNTDSCNCHKEFVDDRLAVLKNFRINKH
jgi:uncharacterized protein